MAITYTPTTNFGAKDSLPANDPDKVIKGSEFTTEFTAIQTAFGLAAPAASPTFTGTVTISSVDINGGAIDGTTIGGTTPAAATFTSLTATTADVNGGTIDGVTIGGSSAGAGSFTTLTASGDVNFDSGTLFVDASADSVGIGTASPTYALDVSTTASSIGGRITTNTSGSYLSFLDNGGLNGYVRVGAVDNNLVMLAGNAERARIDSSGNLLVGKTSADFSDSSRGNVEIGGSGGAILALKAGSTNDYIFNSGSNLDILAGSGQGMLFYTNGSNERMRITSAGNVGIGVTNPGSYYAKDLVVAAADEGGVTVVSDPAHQAYLMFADGTSGSQPYRGYVGYDHGSDTMNIVSSGIARFYTGDPATEKARIDASGNLLVGTTSGAGKLEVFENSNLTEANPHLRITGAGYSGYHWLDATAYYIGQNSASRSLRLYSSADTAGVELAAGGTSWGTFSDERLKENVEPVQNALQSLSGLRSVKYHLKDVDGPEDKKKIGLVAQDLVGVLDEIVDTTKRPGDDTDYLSVRYSEMVPVLVKAIQEQQEIINDLRARVAQLEGA